MREDSDRLQRQLDDYERQRANPPRWVAVRRPGSFVIRRLNYRDEVTYEEEITDPAVVEPLAAELERIGRLAAEQEWAEAKLRSVLGVIVPQFKRFGPRGVKWELD